MQLPEGEIGADIRFAGAGVDHIGIGRRNGDGTDGGDGLLVEDRFPNRAGVGGFPDAASTPPK